MSQFSHIFAFAQTALLSFVGERGDYARPGDAPIVGITLGVTPAAGRLVETDGGRIMINTCRITVQASDVALPAHGDVITVRGEPWTVDTVESNDVNGSIVNATRPVAIEVTARGYRDHL